ARSDASNAAAGRPAEANGASSRQPTTCSSSTTTASLPPPPDTRAAPSPPHSHRRPDQHQPNAAAGFPDSLDETEHCGARPRPLALRAARHEPPLALTVGAE